MPTPHETSLYKTIHFLFVHLFRETSSLSGGVLKGIGKCSREEMKEHCGRERSNSPKGSLLGTNGHFTNTLTSS